MIKNNLFILTIVFTLMSGKVVMGEETGKITVYAMEIEGLFEKDKSGLYDKFFQNLSAVKLVTLPIARTAVEFEKCTNCCYAPVNMNKEFYPYTEENYIESNPMGTAKLFIFSKNRIYTLDTLKGKRVGARHGWSYGKTVTEAQLNFQFVTSIELNIRKLRAGRIDAFLAFTPDAYTAFDNLRIDFLVHDKNNPITIHNDAVVCRRNPSTVKFIEEFNKELNHLKLVNLPQATEQ